MPHADRTRQFALALPLDPAFGEEDFLTSASNETAYALLEQWAQWPGRAAIITGPESCGKSHLAAVFAARTGGRVVAAAALRDDDVPALAAAGTVAVESIDKSSDGTGGLNEDALFHLINLMQENQGTLLLTGRNLPTLWPIKTPDLASRLRRMPLASIAQPDDALMRALLIKQFNDRQIAVDVTLIEYLLPRLERSFGAVRAIVNRLDREALARGRGMTRAFAAELLS